MSSKLAKNQDVVHLDGVIRNIDVVETYLPLRETREGKIIGVMEVYRDIADDVALQVQDSKATVLRTTIATMGGLFLVLFGFIVVADVTIYRSNRRQLSLAEEANQTLEGRVFHRTQELEEANKQLLEAQDQLLRTEKLAAIGQLAGSVAHDLRNPLGVIKNAIYYLRRRLSGSEVAQSNPRIGQFLQIIDQEVEHSNQVIADLMTFARVNAPSLSPTDLLEVLESAQSGMEINENVRVARRFDADLPDVLADSEHAVRLYNGRGTAEQWIKEGKYALNWTRLSWGEFGQPGPTMAVHPDLQPGQLYEKAGVAGGMKHWTLTSHQTRLSKTGGRLVRHQGGWCFSLPRCW